MTKSELSHPIKRKAITAEIYAIAASESERAALAVRFDLSKVSTLTAKISLAVEGANVVASGTMSARWLQRCVVSGVDFLVKKDTKLHFRFVPARKASPDEEVELEADELDDIEYEGDSFDLGEALAQSMGLEIDPFATGPDADKVREEKGIKLEGEQDGPLAEMLAALKIGGA